MFENFLVKWGDFFNIHLACISAIPIEENMKKMCEKISHHWEIFSQVPPIFALAGKHHS